MQNNEVILNAVRTVTDLYGKDVDDQGKPKLMHAFAVAEKFNGDPVFYVLSLLQSVLEDFPDKAEAAIEWLKPADVPEMFETFALLTRHRDEAYADFIARVAASDNMPAKIVKLADIAQRVRTSKDASQYVEAGNVLVKTMVMDALKKGEVHVVHHHSEDEPASENAAPVTLH